MRNSQAQRPRPHRHDLLPDGLRHHRHRARPRAGEVEEARRRRHDVDRQPDDPACAAPPRLHAGADRRHRRLHRRQEVDPRCTPPRRPSTCPVFACSMGDNVDPLRGPRADDGGGAAVPLRRDLQDRQHARGRRRSKTSRRCTCWRGSSGLKAVAIYRDNCKVGQPLSTAKKESDAIRGAMPPPRRRRPPSSSASSSGSSTEPVRQKLPRTSPVADVRVPRRRLQGLRHHRRVRRRPSRRDLPHRVEAGLDARRDHGRVRQVDQPTACSTACRCGRSSRRSPTCGSSRRA